MESFNRHEFLNKRFLAEDEEGGFDPGKIIHAMAYCLAFVTIALMFYGCK